jgi:hypothetical protein
MSMNLRHAAALALVGWYLMLPPVTSGHRVNAEAPLGQWERSSGTYDVLGECHGAIAKLRQVHTPLRMVDDKIHTPEVLARQFASAKCIASDDPRLKEKEK